jgi:dipeptidase D
MDMVCEKNEGVKHDFLMDPITLIINDDWVKAAGTTLGADNAGGLALILAVLALNLSHPPIEAIFTVVEETTMRGASMFDVSRLSGKRLINLDSETEGVFTASSASASDIRVSIPVEYETAPEGFAAYELLVRGLTGGHSGIDINKGRANANVLAARLLSRLEKTRAASIDGGSQKNAIPRECTAVIFFDRSCLTQNITAVEQMQAELRAEYPLEEGLTLTLRQTETSRNVMSFDSQQTVISGILLTPDGVQSMSPFIEGLVQTSNNIGVVKTDGKTVRLTTFFRSADIAGQNLGIKKLKWSAEALGADVEVVDQSPPWEYRENSPLRDAMSAAFKEFYGKDPAVSAIHAGLECAVFAQKMPEGDFISIGMDITGAHSPDEKMSISSFDRTGGFLIKVLEKL